MERTNGIFGRLVAALVLIVAAMPVAAQNLVVNGGFAGNLGGWTMQLGGTVGYSTEDIDLLPNSGSVLMGHSFPVLGARLYLLTQCVPIPTPGSYEVGASGRFSAGAQSADRLILTAQVWDTADCTGTFRGGAGESIPPLPTWRAVTTTLVVGAVPASIEIQLGVEKAAATGTASGRFDRVYVLAGADEMFVDGFE